MRAWKIFLRHLLTILLPIMILDLGGAEAAKKAKKSAVKQEDSPIIGELDESDAIPLDESDNETATGEEEGAALKPNETSKTKVKTSKNKGKNGKEKVKIKIKDKKAEQERKRIMEGFSQAEDFHKMWYNLPPAKIKASLASLTNFCKVTCTKKQCMDEEVANNCHLVCPETTTRQCADPLKQATPEETDTDEVVQGDDIATDEPDLADESDVQGSDSPALASSLEQTDAALMEEEGEGEGG